MKGFGTISAPFPVLAPPLPLLRFTSNEEEQLSSVRTISGESLESIPNDIHAARGRPDKLHNPVKSRRLAKWFSARSQREVNYRHMEAYNKTLSDLQLDNVASANSTKLMDYITYDSSLYGDSKAVREEKRAKLLLHEEVFVQKLSEAIRESPKSVGKPCGSVTSAEDEDTDTRDDSPLPDKGFPAYIPSIQFDAEFECGNLERAVRIFGRESLLDVPDGVVAVDQEYDLTLRNDINTEGNIQWYYFAVNIDERHLATGANLRIRFNITNMQKKDSLYNYGMKPAVLCQFPNETSDWTHGGHDICYYKNGQSSVRMGKGKKRSMAKSLYTLTFSYEFTRPGRYFFAHTFPYTYSDLLRHLSRWEQDERIAKFFHRRTLCETLAGNKCEVITITDRASGAMEARNKPSIVVSARVHPGESNSSFMIHGLIDFLCSESPEAVNLRRTFIFTIVPMLNPDGVVHGNYRCSLAGTDLNRRYADSHPTFHPTIVAFKSLLKTILVNRPINLFLDLHGHSKLKNCFLYGCDLTLQPDKAAKVAETCFTRDQINHHRIFCRLFPKILSSVSKAGTGGYFSYRDCSFRIDRSKLGTGRVVSWRDLGILGSYTIEASFCGVGSNDDMKALRKLDAQLARRKTMDREESDIGEPECRASAGIAAGGAPSGENVELARLAEAFASQTHFQKRDYLAMGKHIAIAIHHFANLSHADLDHELELLLQQDLDLREKLRRNAATRELLQVNVDTSPIFRSSPDRLRSVTDDEAAGASEQPVCCPIENGDDLLQLDPDEQASDVDSVGSDDDEEDDDDEEFFIPPPQQSEESFAYQQAKIELLDATMISRASLKPSLFSLPALHQFVRSYPAEISVEKSTMNLGLRVKCELGIRKALRIEDRGLSVDVDRKEFEERDGSDSGSDSCPSVDNRNAAKILKQAAKGKNVSAVAALRSAMVRAKQKEAQRRRKQEAAAQKRLAKQALQAKKLAAAMEKQETVDRAPSRPGTASAISRDKSERDMKTITLPRFSPAYRLDSKAQIVPVQIKVLNFKPTERRVAGGGQAQREASAMLASKDPATRAARLSRPTSAQPFTSSRPFQLTSTTIPTSSSNEARLDRDPFFESISTKLPPSTSQGQRGQASRKSFYG